MTRTRVGVAVGLVLVLAFYTWTMATSTSLELYDGRIDPYNATASGLLHGRLDLPIAVPPELKALKDPYDAAQRGSILTSDQQDLSYFDGRFYSYWGPVPALLLFIPFRVLGLGDLPPGIAVLVLVVAGLLASLALLRFLVRRYLADVPAWMVGVAGAVLALASTGPYLLRRPAQYEVALGGGYALLMAGLLLLLTGGLRERPSWARLAGGSLCLGLAFGSRPPAAIGIVVALALLWRLRTPKAAAVLLGPFAACVALYVAYNLARFGAVLEFGQGLQLTGGNPKDQHPSLGYTVPGLWYQLIHPPRPRVAFPFLVLGPPPAAPFGVPKAYDGIEPTGGILTCAPFVALLLAAPWALRGRDRALRLVVGAFAAMAAVLVLFITTDINGTTQRYQIDFLPLLLIAAALVWLALARRRAWRVAGAVLAAWAMIVATAVSMTGSKATLQSMHPQTFDSLERFFSPLPTLATQIAGHPIIASANRDATLGAGRYDRLGIEQGGLDAGSGPTVFVVYAPDDGVGTFRVRIAPAPYVKRAVPTMLTESGGSAVGREADGSVQRFAIPLERGRNVLGLRIDTVPAIAPPDPRARALAHIDGFHVDQK